MLTLVALLVACGPSRADFARSLAEIGCAQIDRCLGAEGFTQMGFEDLDDCVASLPTSAAERAADPTTCPEYDPVAAKACLVDYEVLSCEALGFGAYPASCADTCPEVFPSAP